MVADSASSTTRAGGYAPFESPRVSVAGDGTLAAIHEASRVTIVEIPGAMAFAEIGVDPDALASEVAWVGAAPRLIVLSRYAEHCTVHLLDPYGPRTIAEIRLEAPMRLFATVGATALVVGSLGAAVLSATETHLTVYQFPVRVLPVAGGAAAGQFVVALAASIEEWDPQSRAPKRRLRLPRAAAITAVGGSERVVWMTTQQEPARIDVIPLVNRGQPRAHDLPEPIARVASHPRSDLVACIGADSGRLYVIDLDGRARLRVIEPEGFDRIESAALVVGRMIGVVAAQAGHPLAVVPLHGRELDGEMVTHAGVLPRGESAKRRAPSGEAPERQARDGGDDSPETDPAEGPGAQPLEPGGLDPAGASDARASSTAVATPSAPLPERTAPQPERTAPPPERPASLSSLAPAQATTTAKLAPPTPMTSLFRHPTLQPPTARAAAAPSASPAPSAGERFSTWRDRVHQNPPREPIGSASAPASPPVTRGEARQSWRDDIAAWSRAVTAGDGEHDAPSAPAIDAIMLRFDLAPQLHPALALLYAAHLCGERGAAPIDVAHVLDGRWDEALGRGELAARGVAGYTGSRVALSPAILRVLDELPPVTGTLVGEPGSVALLGPCVVVAGDEPLTAVAERCLPRVGGAILAAHGDAGRADLLFEALARGASPMLRLPAGLEVAPNEPAIFVVADAELAERLGVPRLA